MQMTKITEEQVNTIINKMNGLIEKLGNTASDTANQIVINARIESIIFFILNMMIISIAFIFSKFVLDKISKTTDEDDLDLTKCFLYGMSTLISVFAIGVGFDYLSIFLSTFFAPNAIVINFLRN